MGMCANCGEIASAVVMKDNLCPKCQTPESQEEQKRKKEFDSLSISEKKDKLAKNILITTEFCIDLPIEERLGFITAQRVYGMNLFKDLFSSVRDVVGGRVNNVENSIEDGKNELELELLEKAHALNGNAIIGLKIEHNFAANNMISMFATATVVKIQS